MCQILLHRALVSNLRWFRPCRHAEAEGYMGVAVSLLPCCTPVCGISSSRHSMMTETKAEQQRLADRQARRATAIESGMVGIAQLSAA